MEFPRRVASSLPHQPCATPAINNALAYKLYNSRCVREVRACLAIFIFVRFTFSDVKLYSLTLDIRARSFLLALVLLRHSPAWVARGLSVLFALTRTVLNSLAARTRDWV